MRNLLSLPFQVVTEACTVVVEEEAAIIFPAAMNAVKMAVLEVEVQFELFGELDDLTPVMQQTYNNIKRVIVYEYVIRFRFIGY
jgi:hypothetical protein